MKGMANGRHGPKRARDRIILHLISHKLLYTYALVRALMYEL